MTSFVTRGWLLFCCAPGSHPTAVGAAPGGAFNGVSGVRTRVGAGTRDEDNQPERHTNANETI